MLVGKLNLTLKETNVGAIQALSHPQNHLKWTGLTVSRCLMKGARAGGLDSRKWRKLSLNTEM